MCKCSQTRSFQCAWRQGYGGEDWSSNKEAPKIYFASPSYGSNQNQETSTYLIGDQTQFHRTLTQHQTILHRKDTGVQHYFQLCQQRNPSCSFCTYDSAARSDDDSQKNKLYPRLLAWMPCCSPFSMDRLAFHACSNQKPFHKLGNHW